MPYIDGFTLYHAIDSLGQLYLKWLDLWALSHSIARANETLQAVNYFSAFATCIAQAEHLRHREYVKALEHKGVTCLMGHFKSKARTCKQCAASWVQHEEKETDVHIAARLVADAYENRFDRAVLITADSDLAPQHNQSGFPEKGIICCGTPRALQPRPQPKYQA